MTEIQTSPKATARSSIGARRNPETEAAILTAAANIIAHKGIAGLRMETVARDAKAGKATLYRWWPTRGALILAVYQRQKTGFPYKDTGSLRGDLVWFTNHLVEIWNTDVGIFFKAIITEAQSDPDVATALKDYRAERLKDLCELFKRAELRGELPSGSDYDTRAELIMGLMWQRLLTNRLDEDLSPVVDLLSEH